MSRVSTGLREPRARIHLSSSLHPPQAVDRQPRRHADEVGAHGIDFIDIHLRPAQPRLLHDVLSVGRSSEHPIRERYEHMPVLLERNGIVVHVISSHP
jgi:hypothetical protein